MEERETFMKRMIFGLLAAVLLAVVPVALADMPAVTGMMELDYAEHFTLAYCEGGYQLITVLDNQGGESRFLTVPEGAQVPENLDSDVAVLKLPLSGLLVSSNPATSLINAAGALDAVALTTTQREDWCIPEVQQAMDDGALAYVGEYDALDFEVLAAKQPPLAVFSSMLLSVPDVAQKLTELGIPYLLDASNYEGHPLARVEWVRLFGALLGCQEQADAVYAVQKEQVEALPDDETGKTVAVFSHGCAIRLTLAALQGIPLEELGRTPTGSNTAVSLLRAEGADIEVVYRDDARHLTDPACTRGLTLKKRANGLEPGLYFEPLPPELTEFPAACAGRTPDLPAGAAVLTGDLNGTPVGAVAFDDVREAAEGCGWIPLLAVAAPWRRRGYGVQFIGQAVMHYRPLGRDRLRLPAPETEAAERFCREFGFSPADDGRAWEKDIGYDPEFLVT